MARNDFDEVWVIGPAELTPFAQAFGAGFSTRTVFPEPTITSSTESEALAQFIAGFGDLRPDILLMTRPMNEDEFTLAVSQGVDEIVEAAIARLPNGDTVYAYLKFGHVGIIPGLDTFMAELVSNEAVGQGGYALTGTGLSALEAASLQVSQQAVAENRFLSLADFANGEPDPDPTEPEPDPDPEGVGWDVAGAPAGTTLYIAIRRDIFDSFGGEVDLDGATFSYFGLDGGAIDAFAENPVLDGNALQAVFFPVPGRLQALEAVIVGATDAALFSSRETLLTTLSQLQANDATQSDDLSADLAIVAVAEGRTVPLELVRSGLIGDDGANTLRGTEGDDAISGLAGADILIATAGDDTLDGGAGTDSARYDGPISQYRVELSEGIVRVIDNRPDTGPQSTGTDVLIGIEQVQFGDFELANGTPRTPAFPNGLIDLTQLSGIFDVTVEQIVQFVEMYIAYFDRAPAAQGLMYWCTRLAEGMPLEQIAKSFFVQPESRALYPEDLDNGQLVSAVFNNLLGRDPAGPYWENALNAGDVDRPAFMLAVIKGAKANPDAVADVRTVTDKADLGIYSAIFKGLTDYDMTVGGLALYDPSDPAASKLTAKDQIDDFGELAMSTGDDGTLTMQVVGVIDDPFLV